MLPSRFAILCSGAKGAVNGAKPRLKACEAPGIPMPAAWFWIWPSIPADARWLNRSDCRMSPAPLEQRPVHVLLSPL